MRCFTLPEIFVHLAICEENIVRAENAQLIFDRLHPHIVTPDDEEDYLEHNYAIYSELDYRRAMEHTMNDARHTHPEHVNVIAPPPISVHFVTN